MLVSFARLHLLQLVKVFMEIVSDAIPIFAKLMNTSTAVFVPRN